jgi:hypothetical protein
MRLISVLSILLACVSAQAQWTDKAGDLIPDSDDRKSNGGFIAQLIFVTNEQEFFEKWDTPSETVHLDSIETVAINQPISSFVIFGGCQADPTGNCHVTMRFKVTQPDGKIYTETPVMEVWRSRPAPPGRSLEASAEYLKIIVEPDEQRGSYVVMVTVTDQNTGASIELKKLFAAMDVEGEKK